MAVRSREASKKFHRVAGNAPGVRCAAPDLEGSNSMRQARASHQPERTRTPEIGKPKGHGRGNPRRRFCCNAKALLSKLPAPRRWAWAAIASSCPPRSRRCSSLVAVYKMLARSARPYAIHLGRNGGRHAGSKGIDRRLRRGADGRAVHDQDRHTADISSAVSQVTALEPARGLGDGSRSRSTARRSCRRWASAPS